MNLPLSKQKVLVTGAGGFIGSALVGELHALGADVRVFARYTSRADLGLLKNLSVGVQDSLDIIFGDLRDPDAVEKAAEDVEIIFHLGALISIPYSYIHPVEVVQSNVIGTLNVLQACRTHGCCLVHTSTSEVYGTALYTPIDEAHPLQGQSPYSASKIGADKLVESFYRSYGVRAVTVRPFNTYGPGQSARAVIPTIITQALTQNVIHLGNLDARRDFTYVSDTVDGFIKAALTEDVDGETFNLGYGEEVTIGALADLIIALVGRPVEIVVDDERLRPEKSEVMRLLSDNTKASQMLGWQPKVDIRTGLGLTIDWIRQHIKYFHPGHYEL
ncbi:MAG: GDP-mannose 4,6-dehydratase [Brevefilum sp.]